MTKLDASPTALSAGQPQPLGAIREVDGTNFAVYAPDADRLELCLLTEDGEQCVDLPERTGNVWHGFLPDDHEFSRGVGQGYGYRVHGPHDPERGIYAQPEVRLLDPYARALSGPEEPVLNEEGHVASLQAPWGLVLDAAEEVTLDDKPQVPWNRTVIYETHVRGLTMTHPDVPEELRGTYAGLACEPVIRYLKELGVTAVELLPVHAHVDDPFLRNKGLHNYWGYSTLSYFAPEPRYSAAARAGRPQDTEQEFREMVAKLHDAGLEVILDVVYNHTAEGGKGGPLLSWRGLANSTYYWLSQDDLGEYFDFTGTGNSVRMTHRRTVQMVLDSMRHWAALGVDGFRFDLATTLARGELGFDKHSNFLGGVQADPVLSRLKLIAEPWDVGLGGYQVGNFPPPWAEWNDQYRDTVRGFWKGDEGLMPDMGFRLTGSSDIYSANHRHPQASINFITAHDGFTLRDVVSYNDKHNEANGEDNRDGHGNNLSWNMGVEGETDDAEVLRERRKQQRNYLTTLLISQGIPMILGGDELGRTQHGNNNTYAQDNELNWYDWENVDQDLLAFTRRLIGLRQAHPSFRRERFFSGRREEGELPHILWLRHDGQAIDDADWQNPQTKSVGLFLYGGEEDGESRDHLLVLLNASHVDLPFNLPSFREQGPEQTCERWTLLLDTADDAAQATVDADQDTQLGARSIKIFSCPAQ
ncbi:glycogen operon protein GlgX homolog [Deinococcus piscis]|uniref:Glycogen operon protein GlgX homolog n=1 Tax=Deinococcus piscis TaxID=394230 RepID=A0ABQ3K4R7_9DEIO|nr:glycogen debranching protein GlgX [Deinococcus piscis]GHG03676.1 glycogen operon protein GlgX homolog [Deinococcus piscis]